MLPPSPPALWRTAWAQSARRRLHATSIRGSITKLQMPAMSPTMTEGGIADWKKKEGETFTAGEVLLEIETDKATIDVEAQEDGVMGKIITPNGTKNVPVGKIIALLAQEGDDILNLEVPQEEPTTSSSPSSSSSSSPTLSPSPSSSPSSSQPVQSESPSPTGRVSHGRPFFPSVLRLLHENHVSDPTSIKGTGVRGMLTKGDVLAYLGKASGPNGTFKDNTPTPSIYKSQAVLKVTGALGKKEVLDSLGIRQVILTTLLERSANSRTPPAPHNPTYESVIADYLPLTIARHENPLPASPPDAPSDRYLDGLY